MDYQAVFAAVEKTCEDNLSVLCGPPESPLSPVAERLVACMRQIQEHGRALGPVVAGFTAVFHHYDLDAQTVGNGYRSLVKIVLSCLLHILHKARYIASNYQGAFFRAEHNALEMEAYCSALTQLRAMLHLAQRIMDDSERGQLFPPHDDELTGRFVQEYSSMHKACFYGRCLGFQFSPALRPFLQTVVISMMSYGETYGKQQSGLGLAALSLLTSGKYVMDPELRGEEFERITQNLDLQFWKSFWNLTENGLITGFNRMASKQVQVNFTFTVPPLTLRLPLASDPSLSISVVPPVAHWGPGPVHMRLISYDLREGQDSEELLALSRAEPAPVPRLPWVQRLPRSPSLVVHFHGGGFVAQTSRSHESYLRRWSKELGVPVLSVDYSLAPEAPFPRALEECFYAYCWALNNCQLLGSTAERVCLAGDSAGGNLCITVSMKAISTGVRVPDGIMAAYPATLIAMDVSPSRLLTLIDPLLPLGVLAKCLNAYAGVEYQTAAPAACGGTLSALGRDTALLLSDLTQGASNWIQSFLDPTRSTQSTRRPSQAASPPPAAAAACLIDYPEGFEPLRSEWLSVIQRLSSPVVRNPFVSPLLAPDALLKGLPPVHIVTSGLDPLLDDSVMFGRRLRATGQPVSLTVVPDLPHGFLSLSQLAKETEAATAACMARMREVLRLEEPAAAAESEGPSG
ncbi:lipase, hormone-sensitive a [Salarias fasciatus]|uniref:lipase, hormone-sensitive a n=1 Tax=Salarias fasciatus TaxID=181472 RepID=UPI00117652C0|nr:hormone-sensitive lipase-like [Salarias fasciatus]XP_029976127.1 hormone-sensitive lipase-like [Salarias fasciatus]